MVLPETVAVAFPWVIVRMNCFNVCDREFRFLGKERALSNEKLMGMWNHHCSDYRSMTTRGKRRESRASTGPSWWDRANLKYNVLFILTFRTFPFRQKSNCINRVQIKYHERHCLVLCWPWSPALKFQEQTSSFQTSSHKISLRVLHHVHPYTALHLLDWATI